MQVCLWNQQLKGYPLFIRIILLYRCRELTVLLGTPRRFSSLVHRSWSHAPRQPGLSGNAQIRAQGSKYRISNPQPLTSPSGMSASPTCSRRVAIFGFPYFHLPSFDCRKHTRAGYPPATSLRRIQSIAKGIINRKKKQS